MRAPMTRSLLILATLVLAACGDEIGDSCLISSDCSPDGDRICDLSQEDGYCTVVGCNYDTCPEEAVCVRFFVGEFVNEPCDPVSEDEPSSAGTDDCSFDELCTLRGQCVPRSAEARYCMRTCSEDGDCRDSYECRDEEKMRLHGGEPVLAPDQSLEGDLQAFCAAAAP